MSREILVDWLSRMIDLRTGGNIAEAARQIGIHPNTLYAYMARRIQEPNLRNLQKIAQWAGTTVDEFLRVLGIL